MMNRTTKCATQFLHKKGENHENGYKNLNIAFCFSFLCQRTLTQVHAIIKKINWVSVEVEYVKNRGGRLTPWGRLAPCYPTIYTYVCTTAIVIINIRNTS